MSALGGEASERKRIPKGAPTAEVERAGGRSDSRADKEAQQIGSGASIPDLEGEAKANEHRRNQKFRDHAETLFIILLYALFSGFLVLALVWILHMILPDAAGAAGCAPLLHGWLTRDQLDDISGILAGGIIAGLVADHFKKRMGP
jgi:hypothetical protein